MNIEEMEVILNRTQLVEIFFSGSEVGDKLAEVGGGSCLLEV